MSKFLILEKNEIAKIHISRAEEIFDIWERRDDSKWEDLLFMVAEALQITENKSLGIDPYYPHQDEEEEEVVVSQARGLL